MTLGLRNTPPEDHAMKPPTLTTTAGAPVADNQNSVTAGPRGPVLLWLQAPRYASAYR